jgi:hypothetical protein
MVRRFQRLTCWKTWSWRVKSMSAEDTRDWKTQPTTSGGGYVPFGTWMIPPRGPVIEYSEEHERNEFARAALIGILGCDGRPDGDDAKVEWAFTLADKMLLKSKAKPQS